MTDDLYVEKVDDYVKKVSALVFAGGHGSKHKEGLPENLQAELAKPLVPINGTPLIDYLLRTLPKTEVNSVDIILRDIPICSGIQSRITNEYKRCNIWKFPENWTMEATIKYIADNRAEKEVEYRPISRANGAGQYFMTLNANSVHPQELIEDVLKISERMFCEDRGLNCIIFYAKTLPLPSHWKLDKHSHFQSEIMEKNEQGYAPVINIMKSEAVKKLPKEFLTQEEENEYFRRRETFKGTPMHLAEIIEESLGGVKSEKISYTVGHYDRDEDLELIKNLIKGIGIEKSVDSGLDGYD